MSLPRYIKRNRPALWKQIQDEADEVSAALAIRAEATRRDREEEHRRRRIEAAKRQRERQQAKPRKRIASRSASMAAKMKTYNAKRAEFLAARPECFACKQLAAAIHIITLGQKLQMGGFAYSNAVTFANEVTPFRKHAATTIHHLRGRAGKLLLDERHWRGCCIKSHQFIGDNPTVARIAGLLCQPGEWGKQEP